MNEIGLIGKKIGMTREFYKTGQSVPVTVIKFDKGRVIQVITKDKNGYNAIQMGFGKIKNSKLSKQMKGFFAKKNTEPKKRLKEFRVENIENFKEGNEFGIEIFKDTKFVDIRSKTIGKGFAGAMKRHNFAGLRATHGVSISHRSHGSTGQRQDPGKVFKNKKMAGHMGDKIRTIQNIEIIKSDLDNNLLYLKGSIPGSKNTEVLVKKSVKNLRKLTMLEKIEKMNLITLKTKQKNEIIGSTSKIYAQKGTGNARHASRKAPIFVGGGVAHGPKGQTKHKIRKLNKNEKKIGVASLLTKKIKLNDLLIFNDFSKEIKKTKEIFSLLNKFHAKNSIMILDKSSRNNILKATRNIPNVKCTDVNHFSAFDIIKYKKIIFTETSIKELEKRYT